jgi:PKHD-type hydroxylase
MFWFEPPSQLIGWDYNASEVLDNTHIEFIEDYVSANRSFLRKAQVQTGTDIPYDDNYRRSDIFFFTDFQSTQIIYEKLYDAVMKINSNHFKYSICYIEPLQYSVYKEEVAGFYNVHCDSHLRNTSGFIRKISFSILLNDPSEFEGGQLLFHIEKEPIEAKLEKKGDMVLFPSFIPHSVTPVTKGVRKTLVGWICGPNLV